MEKENVISIKHLKKSFGDFTVLNDVNMDIYRGESVVLLGKSGTGKSVILQNIVGLLKPDEGDVIVLKKNIPELDEDELLELRKKIGFLFQSGALYDSMTVRENLEFPLRRHFKKLNDSEVNELVEEALEDVSLLPAIDKMPSELSGGMKKRAGLARTIILQPEIMLYDEPTTGLDPATSREISQLILKMQEKFKVSSLIITHDMDCTKLTSNKIAVLKEGKIAATGNYEELSKLNDPFIKSFFLF
ncbi:MAG: ATP-binding cassette domain-containing protein [Ignavibacteria bacterium]|jgi:phospholipid/cholesterol/gamma-HCH transport system ATP-binding protein